MASSTDSPGVGSDLTRQASQQVSRVADWLEDKDGAGLLDDIRGCARRSPGTFLLGAAAAGLLAGRLTRGVQAASSSEPSTGTPSPSPNGRQDTPTGVPPGSVPPPPARPLSSPQGTLPPPGIAPPPVPPAYDSPGGTAPPTYGGTPAQANPSGDPYLDRPDAPGGPLGGRGSVGGRPL